MTVGHVRDYFPRVTLTLAGRSGPLNVEFILDTAFDGELALPPSLLAQMDAAYASERSILLADSSVARRAVYEAVVEWEEEERITDVLVLDGNPLLGMIFLDGYHIHIEDSSGGEVVIEPL